MSICFSAKAQIVSIPDAKFKAALIAVGIDKNNDGEIQESEALQIKKLDVSSKEIGSLEGIAAFKYLTELKCNFNELYSLDLSKNFDLEYVNCGYNKLYTLNISGLAKLNSMYCYNNNLTTLDCSHLDFELLYCSDNQLKELDLSASTDLIVFDCTNNPSLSKIYIRTGTSPGRNWAKDAQTDYIPKDGFTVVKETKPVVTDTTATNTTSTNKEDKSDSDTSLTKKLTDVLKDLFGNDNQKKEDDSKCVSGNCVNGVGTLTFTSADGPATYKGSFKNGKFNGQGSLVVKDAYKYTGSFKDGSIDGKGTYTYSTGEVYTGEIKNGIIEGNGTMTYKNGKKSTGIWKENKFWSGIGYFIYEDNSSYYGGVKENMPDGQGVRNFTNGKTFIGTFSKGEPLNGKGYFFFTKDNTSYEGTLVNGKFSGMGIYSNLKGDKFTGNFVDGSLTGAGKWTGADGGQYDGNFKDGTCDGYGVFKFKDGTVYKGNFTNNKEDGQGDLYDASGKLDYSGKWNNGKMVNPENSASYKKSSTVKVNTTTTPDKKKYLFLRYTTETLNETDARGNPRYRYTATPYYVYANATYDFETVREIIFLRLGNDKDEVGLKERSELVDCQKYDCEKTLQARKDQDYKENKFSSYWKKLEEITLHDW